MTMARKFMVLSLLAGLGLAPAARALADDSTQGFQRKPAAAAPETPSKKKKKKKKAVKGKAKKKKKSGKATKRSHAATSSSHSKSHAPKVSAPIPDAPKYPTQPANSFDNVPNEKKDDLPPPQTPPND